VTRGEIIEHMKVMGQNAARMDEVMMYVMTRKDCEVVMAAAELLEAEQNQKNFEVNPNCHGLGHANCEICDSPCPYR
jgi:hypothetical protein